jgi:hypothetical protein
MFDDNANRNHGPILNYIPSYSSYGGIGGVCASWLYNLFESIIGLITRTRQVAANGTGIPQRIRINGPRIRKYATK